MVQCATGNNDARIALKDDDNNPISAQYPLSTDGDSVYVKDIDLDNSSIGDFTALQVDGMAASVLDLFDNRTSIVRATDDPVVGYKSLLVALKRPINNLEFKLITAAGNFSNVMAIGYDASGAVLETIDDSANNTKYTANRYNFVNIESWCVLEIRFYTTDDVTLSFICAPKSIHVISHLHALKPDGSVTPIDATAGGNLKVSVEEGDNELSPVYVVQNDPEDATRHGEFDNLFKVPIGITIEHHEVHDGATFCLQASSVEASGDAIEILITPPGLPGKEFHLVFEYDTSGAGVLEILEDVQTPGGGAAVTPTQHNANSGKVSSSTLSKTGSDAGVPLTYTGGTTKWREVFGSGKTQGGKRSRGEERILKAGVSSVVRLESSAAANILWLGLTWYEHTAG